MSREEFYVCDRCGLRSQDGTFWIRMSRLGRLNGWADPLIEERDFCTAAHAAEWLSDVTVP